MTEVVNLSDDANLEHNRLVSLVNSMGDGVIAIDDRFNVVIYNGAALNILDINATIVNKPIADVLHLVDKKNQPIDTLDFIKSIKTAYSTRDLAIPYTDGSIVKLYLSLSPVHLGFGQAGTKGYVLLLRDITREKSLEEERDEFISVASHELRTPIAIAEGNISNARLTLKRGGDPSALDHALAQAYDQIIFLASLINDLSTLSRAEGGRLKLDVGEVNAYNLVDELAASYRPQAEAKQLQLLTDIDTRLEIFHSSELYVKEILQNFVTNAIKYTQKGQITIGARTIQKKVQFWVQDTGIGISKSDQEKVFNKFFRSEDYRTKENKGTGLGLYVTVKLAHLLNGQISMSSELNKGSKFSLLVPDLPDNQT